MNRKIYNNFQVNIYKQIYICLYMGICLDKSLSDYNIENTKEFSVYGYKSEIKVLNIIHKYNLLIILPIFNNYYQFEIKLANTNVIKNQKKKIKNRLLELIFSNNKYNSKTFDENIIINILCCRLNKKNKLICYLFPYNTDYVKSFNQIILDEFLNN